MTHKLTDFIYERRFFDLNRYHVIFQNFQYENHYGFVPDVQAFVVLICYFLEY